MELDAPEDSVAWQLANHYLQPIASYFKDPSITSIAINRWDTIFVKRAGQWIKTGEKFSNEDHLVSCITQVIHNLSQVIDPRTHPIADARLADGSRVNAVLWPTAHTGSNMTIRIFPKVRYTVEDLLEKGAMSAGMLKLFRLAIAVESNILVSGATGSGKTTILNALGNLIPDHHRIGVIEDTAELKINKPNIVSMEAPKRTVGDSGKLALTMEDLLVNTLRQELRSIIVGEVREPKAATALMLALNTGHNGVLSTLHANSPKDALGRLVNMLMSNDTRVPYDAVVKEIHGNFNLIVQCENTPRHGQRVVAVAEIVEGEARTVWEWDYLRGEHKQSDPSNQRRSHIADLAIKYGLEVDMT